MRSLIPLLALSLIALFSCTSSTQNTVVDEVQKTGNIKFLKDNIKLHKDLLADNTNLTVTYSLDSLGKLTAFYNPNGFDITVDTNLDEHSIACMKIDIESCLLKIVSEGKSVSAKSCAVCFYVD